MVFERKRILPEICTFKNSEKDVYYNLKSTIRDVLQGFYWGFLRKKRDVADSNRVEYYLSIYREIEEREIK
ncbi:MAG: hypothetical protein FJ110_14715 [Deltaproteobacteria bacterium]|nr:hypothetical protein [Deltaproteobacteria bacterium]